MEQVSRDTIKIEAAAQNQQLNEKLDRLINAVDKAEVHRPFPCQALPQSPTGLFYF